LWIPCSQHCVADARGGEFGNSLASLFLA
jgi:hypothetical protein